MARARKKTAVATDADTQALAGGGAVGDELDGRVGGVGAGDRQGDRAAEGVLLLAEADLKPERWARRRAGGLTPMPKTGEGGNGRVGRKSRPSIRWR